MIASTPWVTALVTNSTWPVLSEHDAGADELGLGDAELAGGLDGPLVGLVEHGDAGALRQQDAGEVAAAGASVRVRRVGCRRTRRSRRARRSQPVRQSQQARRSPRARRSRPAHSCRWIPRRRRRNAAAMRAIAATRAAVVLVSLMVPSCCSLNCLVVEMRWWRFDRARQPAVRLRRECMPAGTRRRTAASGAEPLDEVLGEDRADEDRSDDPGLGVAADVGETESVAEVRGR